MIAQVKQWGLRKPVAHRSTMEIGNTTTLPPKKRGKWKVEYSTALTIKLDE